MNDNNRTQLKRGWRGQVVGATFALVLGLLVAPSFAQSDDADKAKRGPNEQTTETTSDLRESPSEADGKNGKNGKAGPADGQRVENVSLNLTLQSARIELTNLDDAEDEFVVYKFAQVVNEVKAADAFALSGYDSDAVIKAKEARLVQGDPSSILVHYAPGTDVARYTIASVETGAVEDEADQANLPGSAPLEGSSVGQGSATATEAPNLVTARPVNSLERVVYSYDEQIDGDNGQKLDAAKFGWYTLDGKLVRGSSIVTVDDNMVTVQFDRQTEDAVRFIAEDGAAKNRKGIGSTLGATGGPTTAPDLVAVEGPIGNTQYDLRFDMPVTNVALDHIGIYAVDGTRYQPTGFAQPAAEVIRIALPEIHEFPGNMALVTVGQEAVRSADASSTPSTVGSQRIGGMAPMAGMTSGPNLASVNVDQATGQIRFIFDRAIDNDLAYDPSHFKAVTASGDLVPARFFVEAADNSILMTFDRNVASAARAVSLDSGAVKDFKGESNPARTLGL
ncbi:MAG TPA: hypothetical protein VG795_04675 [Acidimicrobiia bacterium]|nr:hypothetical protein [Acidimicrobiia bacterium]